MKTISTDKAPKAIGPYSQAYVAAGLIFTSGQIPIEPVTGEIPEGIKAQTSLCCNNIKAILKEAGSSMDKVIKTCCFIADMADFTVFNAVYAEYFTSKPARSCVAVKELPKGVLCEVEAVAEI